MNAREGVADSVVCDSNARHALLVGRHSATQCPDYVAKALCPLSIWRTCEVLRRIRGPSGKTPHCPVLRNWL